MNVEVSHLHFHYGTDPVLDDVTFTLKGGELLTILGPNGAGKTTLLKCINAMHRPQQGSVLIDQKEVFHLRPEHIAHDIGYVAQHSETARLSVFDAVLMGRKPHIRWRISDADLRIVESALRQLHIDHLSLRPIHHLSGGELQKVAIGRALVQEPKLLLMDEPTASLDLKSQVDILKQIRHIVVEHKMAVLMTLHDLNTALRYSDTVLFLKEGRIHFIGAPAQVNAHIVEEVYGVAVCLHTVDGHPLVVPKT